MLGRNPPVYSAVWLFEALQTEVCISKPELVCLGMFVIRVLHAGSYRDVTWFFLPRKLCVWPHCCLGLPSTTAWQLPSSVAWNPLPRCLNLRHQGWKTGSRSANWTLEGGASYGGDVLQMNRLPNLVTKPCGKVHLHVIAVVPTLCILPGLLLQLLEPFFLAFSFCFFSFNCSTLLSSSSWLLLPPAYTTQARSPLESSVPCLAARTADDGIRVQRSPSVGWLSKFLGEGEGMRVGWGRCEEGVTHTSRSPNACCCMNSVLCGLAAALSMLSPLFPPSVSLWFAFIPSSGMKWVGQPHSPSDDGLLPKPSGGISFIYWTILWLFKGLQEFCHQCSSINAMSLNVLISI